MYPLTLSYSTGLTFENPYFSTGWRWAFFRTLPTLTDSGNEFCPHPKWTWKQTSQTEPLRENTAKSPLDGSLRDPEQRTRARRCPDLWPQNCEIINGCCLNPLRLWYFVMRQCITNTSPYLLALLESHELRFVMCLEYCPAHCKHILAIKILRNFIYFLS